MKQQLYLITVLSIFLLGLVGFNPPKAVANHAMAVDLGYKCLGGNLYEIKLAFYLDCGSTVITEPPVAPPIKISSVSCAEVYTIELEATTDEWDEEVSQLCTLELFAGNSNCTGGTLPGVKQFVYKGYTTLPQNCADWVFSYRLQNDETRSITITNITAPDLYKIYVEATLNNLQGCNNSPTFNTIPVAYFCNQPATFTTGSVDTDGDELVFSLTLPLDNANDPIDYNFIYTPENPFGNTSFNFDTTNGQIDFTPNGAQIPVVAMLVEEYRNGELIGSVLRDMQFVILDCANQQVNATLPNSTNYFEVCPGELLTFDITASDPDSGDIIDFDIIDLPNNAEFTTQLILDATQGTFEWTPSELDAGTHQIPIHISDEACPISSYLNYNITIQVAGSFDIGLTEAGYCESGGPIIIDLAGGDTYQWSPNTGITFLNANNSLVEIDLAGSAVGEVVNYTITNNCGYEDNLEVTVEPSINIDLMDDFAICQEESLQITTSATPNSSYTYQWTPTNSIADPTVLSPIVFPVATTTYTLVATNNNTGCSTTSSVTIGVSTSSSEITVSADDELLCPGESTQLYANVAQNLQVTCGINSTDCSGASTFTLGESGNAGYDPNPFYGLWETGRLQMLVKQEELVALGMTSGNFDRIAFNVTNNLSAGGTFYEDFNIRMACVDLEELTGFEPIVQSVISPSSLSISATGWISFFLEDHFAWDGESDILIETCYSNTDDGIFDEIALSDTPFASTVFDSSGTGNGCALTDAVSYTQRPDMQFGFCPFISDDAIDYGWVPVLGLSDPNIANPIATPPFTTTYTVSFDNNGCIGAENITIVVSNLANLALPNDTTICEGSTVPLSVNGSIPSTATVIWSPTNGLENPSTATTNASPSETTTYTLDIDFNDGCTDPFNEQITITVLPISIDDISPDQTINEGETANLSVSGNFDTVTWSPIDDLTTFDSPSVAATPSITTTYTATVSNGIGCSASVNVLVTVIPENTDTTIVEPPIVEPPVTEPPIITTNDTSSLVRNERCSKLIIPNAFSPNEDGHNDTFAPHIASYDALSSFIIYNRWGKELFNYTPNGNTPIAWDGTYKGTPQPIGTYVYYVQGVCEEQVLVEKGWVVLVR